MTLDPKLAMEVDDSSAAIADNIRGVKSLIETLIQQVKPASELADTFVLCRTAYDRIDEARKELLALRDSLSYEKIPDVFDEQGIKTLTTQSGYRVTVSGRLSASIVDKDKAFQWLRERDLGAIIVETVNSGTLSATMRDLIKNENIEPPADAIKVSTIPYTSITQVK